MTAGTFHQPVPAGRTEAEYALSRLLLGYARQAADTPRSRQKNLGMSEYGERCVLQVASKVAGREPVSDGGDKWASTLGTWGHAGLTETIRQARDAADWLLDRKVLLGGMVPGTLDAFHIPSGTIVDFKFCGPDTITKYRRNGPPQTYIAQAHGYGVALAEEGYDVRRVALAFYPRSHSLAEFWLWDDDLDPSLPERLLKRIETIYDLLDALKLWDGANPDGWSEIPATPSSRCVWCPFYKRGSTSLATGCPGDSIKEVAA